MPNKFTRFRLGRPLSRANEINNSKRVIFDSDYGPDVDDLVAHCLLNAFVQDGTAQVIANLCCISNAQAAASMSSCDTWHGNLNVPIGYNQTTSLFPLGYLNDGPWALDIYANSVTFPRQESASSVGEAVAVARAALAASPDNSVRWIIVGMMSNLHHVLLSPADPIDPRTGLQLVAAKVESVWQMGGRESGGEFNLRFDKAASNYCADNCPVPIYWNQASVGGSIFTGKWTGSEHDGHILKYGMIEYENVPGSDGGGRQSWDPMTVFAALREDEGGFSFASGTMTVELSDGSNTWTPGAGPHYNVTKTLNDSDYETAIEALLWRPEASHGITTPQVNLASIAEIAVNLDASAIVGLSNGDAVNTWEDSAESNDAILQAAGVTYVDEASPSGLPAVRFDGVGWLKALADPSYKTGDVTFFVVAKPSLSSGYRTIAGVPHAISSHASPYFRYFIGQNGNNLVARWQGNSISVTSGMPGGEAHIYMLNEGDVFRDASEVHNGTPAALTYPNDSGLHIGANGAGSEIFIGDIYQVVAISRNLTAEESSGIVAELTEKWL